MERRVFLGTLACGLLAAPLGAEGQLSPVARIGYLSSETASAQANRLEALRAGLRDLGYVEGQNMVVEVRRADGHYDRLPELATELVRLKVNLIVCEGIKAAVAAEQATKIIPIVVPATADLVGSGLAAGLERPGGNVTGSVAFGTELAVKRLELLREAVPRATQVAFLLNPVNVNSRSTLQALEAAAKGLRVSLRPFEARAFSDLDRVFGAITRAKPDGVVVQADTMFDGHLSAVAQLAARGRLPSAGRREFAHAGGLIGYGANNLEYYRRAATIVDKILKGAKAGDLPIERATKFELVINVKAAQALGLTIPPSVLARADQVIE